MVEGFEKERKFEKPEFLYHGTNRGVLDVLRPENERIRDKFEGKVLFATPDKAFASMFLGARADDSWSIKAKLNNTWYTAIADEKRFRNDDAGGVIFTLDSGPFECDTSRGMGKNEWCTKEDVRPLKEEKFDSGLDAMIENGVQVYFTNIDTLHKLKEAITKQKDFGVSLLEKLQSENQRLGKNIRLFREDK